MALVRFQEVKSNRGKNLLFRNGFEYCYENDSRVEQGWEYWRCPRRPPYCPGRASIQMPWLVDEQGRYKFGKITAGHNHPANFGQYDMRQANERLREEAQTDFPTTSRNIVRDVRADLPFDVRVNAPSAVNMRNNYNLTKKKHFEEVGDAGLDVLPIENIVVPERLQNRVIFNDIFNGHRMIVFCSESGLDTLRQYYQEIAIDGTFESSPRGFTQLYTVSSIIEHCSVPCAYALLASKEAATYIRFFEVVRDSIGANWAPLRIMSDFEASAISATTVVFPNSIKSGCLFHFGQSLYRRIQRLPNLHTRYLDSAEFQRSIRSIQSLAFVPLEHVYAYFCILMSTLNPTEELQELIEYFIMNWIGPRHVIENEEPFFDENNENMGGAADGWIRNRIEQLHVAHRNALFPIELWNMVERVDTGLSRTNNSVEGWHAVWNAHLRGNQRLSSFIRKMITEDEMWAERIADYQVSPADGIRGPHSTRKAKYIRQDNNLNAILQDFDNRDPIVYLRAITYHLHF